MKKIRILIVEDDSVAVLTACRMLQNSDRLPFVASECATLDEGLQRCRTENPDIVLLDLGLPDSRGLATLNAFSPRELSAAILVVTGLDDNVTAFEAIEAGAQGYLIKGHFDAGLLTRSIISAIDRKKSNEALWHSEMRYRELVENLNDVVFEVAQDGIITYVSPVIERVLGYIPKDILAQSYASLIHPDDLSSVQRSFADVLAGRLYPSDFRMRRRDGTFSWVRTSSRPIHKDGQIVGLQGILTDITTHKLSEERIREFSHRLLSVREQEKCRLSAALHHDVGSMAVGVSARMRAAEEDLRAGKADEALAAIEECRKLFNQSVERLKVLAVDLRPPDLDILGLTAALRQYFAGVTRDTALRIRFSDSSQGAVIEQDLQTVLFRIAQECVTNAIKHAKASAVRVTLAATKRSIVLSVTDNGKGFAPVQVPSRAGAGLGLIIMHEMVTVRGGEMTVDSAPGRGTKVKAEFHRNGDAVGTTGSPDSDPPPIGRNDAHSHIDC